MESVIDAKALKAQRTKLYTDLYSGIIPERVPVSEGISLELMIQYAGKDLMTTQFNYQTEEVIEIMEKAMEISRGDDFNAAFARNPVAAMLTKNTFLTMSNSGFIQHPETCLMEADEYDELIADPETFIGENIIPRMNRQYQKSPTLFAISYARNFLASMDQNMTLMNANLAIQEKYGFYAPTAPMTMSLVPFDEIADTYRGFKNINVDIRRQPQKLLDAMEALMPKNIALQKAPYVDITGVSAIMTHMGVFLNTKDFEKFYWPNFAKLCHIAGERGQHMFLFCEGDWMRFLDHLYDLPAGCRMAFEYGDPQRIKDKLGKKHILSGLYPITYLNSKTKQECIDKAKEVLDIMAVGGNYWFSFDKQALALSDINVENYSAVLEYVRDNSKYTNAGQRSSGFDFVNFQDTVKPYLHEYPEFKSKYDLPFSEFIADYPVPDERVLPIMRQQYEKYVSMIPYPKMGF